MAHGRNDYTGRLTAPDRIRQVSPADRLREVPVSIGVALCLAQPHCNGSSALKHRGHRQLGMVIFTRVGHAHKHQLDHMDDECLKTWIGPAWKNKYDRLQRWALA